MKKFSKIIIILLAAIMGLAGCTSKGGAKEDKVTITYWNFPNFVNDSEYKTSEDYDRALIAAFEEKNPDIKVEYQKLDFSDGPAKVETAIQSKTNPDVIYDAPGRVIDWANKGYLLPYEGVDQSKMNKSVVEASSLDGKLYLYPQGSAPFLMAVNKKITDELGITNLLPLDREDRNWDVEEFETFLRAVKTESKDEIIPTVLFAKSPAGDQGPRAFVSNLYGSWITDDAVTKYTINDDAGVKGLEWIASATKDGLLGSGVSLEANDAAEYFTSGKAAMAILSSPGLRAAQKDAEALDAVFVPYPNVNKSPKFEFLVAGPAVFDNEDENKAEAARKFVDFMVNDSEWGPRTLKATGNFSVLDGEQGMYEGEELKFAESLTGNYGPYYNTIKGFPEMRTLWFPMLQSVMGGEVEAKVAIDDFVEQAQKTLE